MKKFFTLVCMITCVFGLTACGSEEKLTDYEQQKVEYAAKNAAPAVVDTLAGFADDAEMTAYLEERTAEEVRYIVQNNYQFDVDGNAFVSGIGSFRSAMEEIGTIVNVGEAEARIDDDQIIVTVDVEGEKKNATAEIIFSNDMFMMMESAALNPVTSIGAMMGKAALNTLIGMGTVFIVLILISLIISCFRFIPKIQAKFEKKDKTPEVKPSVSVTAAPVVEEAVEEEDDLELVAVIAAAIAASEGAASTDGFVVRSIRKVNRSRR